LPIPIFSAIIHFAIVRPGCTIPISVQEDFDVPRFFVEPEILTGSFAVLEGEQAAHAKVLRLGRGDEVTLCDGQGREAQCTISDFSPGQVSLVIHSTEASHSEPKLQCSVYMGFPKADKFEHVVQKATELGAYEIIVFPCTRSISRPDAKSLAKKLDRWQKIAASAAEQSGRGRIPQVLALGSFSEAITRASQADFSALFYENERTLSLRAAVETKPFTTAALMTGPEGGLTEQEVQAALDAGMSVCSLGPRILRCETAPLCALSALMYAADELA